MKKPSGYWTIERIKEEASKYSHKSEFEKGCRVAYDKACRLKIIDDLGFKPLGNLHKRCIYSVEFEDNHVYVGLTYNFDRRIQAHFNKLSEYSSVLKYHTANPDIKYKTIQLTEYVNKSLAAIKEGDFVNLYKDKGWVILNKAKTGALGGGNSPWTLEDTFKVALLYDSPNSLLKSKDRGAYYYAVDHNLLDKLIYAKPRTTFIKWNKDISLAACLKYKDHKEIIKSPDYGAYQYLQRHKLLAEIKYKQDLR